jgi:hypothetical protein
MARGPVNFDRHRLFPAAGNRTAIGGGLAFRQGASMQFEVMTAEGRLFDFDIWDWSMILGGSLIVCFIALLV